MPAIDFLDTVELIEDVDEAGLRKGAIGTVVERLGKEAFLVEFDSEDEDDDHLSIHALPARVLRLSTSYAEMHTASKQKRWVTVVMPTLGPRIDIHGTLADIRVKTSGFANDSESRHAFATIEGSRPRLRAV